MHARLRAMTSALVALAFAVAPNVGASVLADRAIGSVPVPPTVTGLCSTEADHVWTIASTVAGLASYDVEYSTDPTFADWAFPITLKPDDPAGHSATVGTATSHGSTLYARWAAYPDQVGSSTVPSTAACAGASIVIHKTVQGGAAAASAFDFTLTATMPDPPFTARGTTHVKADVVTAVSPGSWIVTEPLDTLPAGYVWLSTTCAGDTTTDPKHPRMIVWAGPGDALECTIVNHHGPVLSDSIAPGVNTGTTGFGLSSVAVPKGSSITYLITTYPNLAGGSLEIWTRPKGGSWKLATTRTVALDGTVHYYAKVNAWAGYQARFAGDDTYAASSASGRTAAPSAGQAVAISVSCGELTSAQDPGTGKAAIVRDVPVKVGGTVIVTLCENASTGMSWGAPTFDHAALALVSHVSKPPTSGLAGAPGTATWTFKALQAKTSVVSLDYGQSWTGGLKAVWTFTMTVRATR